MAYNATTTHHSDGHSGHAASVLVVQRALQLQDLDKAIAAFLQLPAVDSDHEQWLDAVLRDAYRAGMFHISAVLGFLKRLPHPEWTLDGCSIINSVHKDLEASQSHIHQVPTLPLAFFLSDLMLQLDGNPKARAQSYWYEWVSPAVRAIVQGRAVRFESFHHKEILYAGADDLSFDSVRRSLFTWQPEWTADGRKDEWLFIPATDSRDRFLLQNLQYNEMVYAADHMKLAPDANGTPRSRVFSWRRKKEDIGGMGVWQLVRVDPSNRDVFALYNPYQNQYLYAPDDERDRQRRHLLTASHKPDDAVWLGKRKWIITPVESSLLEKAIEAFFTKQYTDTVDLCTRLLEDELSDRTEQVKCYVYRMAANLRLTNIGLIQADFDSLASFGGGKAASFHGLHHLWAEVAAIMVDSGLSPNQRLRLLPVEIQLQRADQLFAGKNYQGALRVYEEIVNSPTTLSDLKAKLAEAEIQVAKCYVASGQIQNALTVLDAMLKPRTEPLTIDVEARVLLWIGRCKRQQKLFDDALHVLERAFNTIATASDDQFTWIRQSISLEMQVVEICRRELLSQLMAASSQTAETPAPSVSCQLAEEMIHALQCPLSLEFMQDPVVSPHGTTYERSMIEHHLDVNGQFDPLTRTALVKTQLAPNRALKTLMETLLSEHKLHQLLQASSS